MMPLYEIKERLRSVRGTIKHIMAPYPFVRNYSLKHFLEKVYVLTPKQIEDLLYDIETIFNDKEKVPFIKRGEMNEDGVGFICIHVRGHVSMIPFFEEN